MAAARMIGRERVTSVGRTRGRRSRARRSIAVSAPEALPFPPFMRSPRGEIAVEA